MPFESLQILFYYFCLCKPAQSHVRVELMTSLKEIRRATDWDRERWWGEVWGGKKRWRTDGIFFGWEPLQFDMDLSDPVSIILVTAGSRGQKVLFRYPYQPPSKTELHEKGQFNIYCLTCGFNSRTGRSLFVFIIRTSKSNAQRDNELQIWFIFPSG